MTETYARLKQQITERGPWQQTASGTAFFLDDPRASEVSACDVAVALGKQCRYNGHTEVFYSVAQHATMISVWMQEDNYPLDWCLAGLHHDSAEAYTGDIIAQVKHLVPAIKELENRVDVAVREAFGIVLTDEIRDTVKEYDFIALSTEVRDLLSQNLTKYSWGDLPPPRFQRLKPLGPEAATIQFYVRHNFIKRKLEEGKKYA